jgi:methyl-accepting chemotaxis protein
MLNRIKIGGRLMIGFGLLMLVIAGLSGFAYYSGSDARDALANVVRLKGDEVASQRVEKRVLEARVALWMGLATGDQSASARFGAALKAATLRADELVAVTTDPKRLAAANALKSELDDYASKAAKELAIGGKNPALDLAENKALVADAVASTGKLTAIAEPLTDAYSAAAEGLASETAALLSRTAMIAMITGIVSLLLGCGLSFVVSRSITGPVRAMTNAMQSLAKGDMATRIPATDSRDEIGEMAKSVEVFKTNMIETERLRGEQEALKQRAAEERRKAMFDLAGRFEANAGSIVTGVTVQATELQATAQSMASSAEETSRQSSTVAAASEQATQNVNTVAAATEELAASVREILQRVTESTQITNKTAIAASAANTEMMALASAMDRIGQVVGLINGIAGQTNLLALNATIEAARAGDAGKGFAVVASEVKALANQTAKATEDISAQISAIQTATRASVSAIQGIVTQIGQVNETAAAIATAVEEQGAATAEIARNVAEAAKGTGEVTTIIAGVDTAAQQSGVAAGEVLAAASSLSQNSEELKVQVDAFLREVRAA